MTRKCKTTVAQPTGIPPRRRGGGQPGNRNAAKPVPTLSARLRDLRRRIRAALKAVP